MKQGFPSGRARPDSGTVPVVTELEVLDRVRAVRNGCDAVLEGRVNPDVAYLAALVSVLSKAMQWQAGHPPEDLEDVV